MNLARILEHVYQGRMSQGRRQGLLHHIAALFACVGILMFAFAAPASSHAPDLHKAGLSNPDHVGEHGHSHDDDDELPTSHAGKATDHHHADHSHEKLGQVVQPGCLTHLISEVSYSPRSQHLVGEPPFGIDRPPRAVTFA